MPDTMSQEDRNILIRVDERTAALATATERMSAEIQSLRTQMTNNYITLEQFKQVEKLEHELQNEYVTRREFEPVQKLVYGLATAVLLAALGALAKIILR